MPAETEHDRVPTWTSRLCVSNRRSGICGPHIARQHRCPLSQSSYAFTIGALANDIPCRLSRQSRHRRRWASAIRARPASVFGPVDNQPWKRQRPFPNSTLTMQVPPARVLAPQSGQSLRRRHHLDRSEFAADGSHKSYVMRFREFGACRDLLPIGDPRQHRSASNKTCRFQHPSRRNQADCGLFRT